MAVTNGQALRNIFVRTVGDGVSLDSDEDLDRRIFRRNRREGRRTVRVVVLLDIS